MPTLGEERSTTAEPQSPVSVPSGSRRKAAGAAPALQRHGVPVWKKAIQWIVLLALFAAAFAALTIPLNQQTSDRTDTLDFANFYVAGRIVRQGQSKNLYNLALQQKIEREISPGGPFQPYYHPPFQALLFAPFTLLSYPHAFLLWAAMNLLVLGLIIYLLRFTGSLLDTAGYWIWMAICLFFVLVALALGQDTLLLALVFLLAFLALKRRRDYAAGLVLGLGLFRFEILLPFVFIFLLRRRWKLFAGFCTVGAALLAVSAAIVGWSGLVRYVQTLVEVGGAGTGAWADRSSASMMPCLRGAFDTLLGGALPHNFLFPAILTATLALLGWAAWEFKSVDRPGDPSFDLEFSLAMVAALLAGYHVFLSELTPLIVAGLLILSYEATRPRKGILEKRRGTALLLLVFAVVAGGALVHSQAFSVEAIVMLGMMVWLSREISNLRSPAALT
jgi:hypothetical protein